MQQFGRCVVLCWLALKHADKVCEVGAAHGSEDVHVSVVSAWLCGHVCNSVPANHIAAEEVTTRERQNDLRPPGHIEASVSQFKWKVPNNPEVCLGRLIGMLRNALFVALLNYCGNLQSAVASRFLLGNQRCSRLRFCCS